jgi:hypothetical protein
MDIQLKITQDLGNAGLEYLEIGINRFHRTGIESHRYYQSTIGNICIGVELTLKALVADHNLSLLFSNLPIEAKVKLTDRKSKRIDLPPYISQSIEDFSFNSIELDKCISIFYHLHPYVKQEFNPFLRSISSIRNVSIHGVTPDFQKYHLEWVTYSAISLLKFLTNQGYSFLKYSPITKEDEEFYKNFDKERNEHVQKAVEKAREKAKHITPSSIAMLEKDWCTYIIKCPICKSDAFLKGYSDFEYEKTYDGADVWLSFHGSEFECTDCMLTLTGIDELKLVGIELIHDISEELDDWLEEHRDELNAEDYL